MRTSFLSRGEINARRPSAAHPRASFGEGHWCRAGFNAVGLLLIICGGAMGCTSEVSEQILGGEETASLVLELTIGMTDGPSEYLFSSIASLLVAKNGTLWVVDGFPLGRPMVRQYDSGGRYIRDVGGIGEGPGEFRIPSALAEMSDGRIVMRDLNLTNRLNVYQPDGTLQTVWSLPGPFPGFQVVEADSSGIVWMPFSHRSRLGSERETGVLRLHSDGSIMDTVSIPERPPVEYESVMLTKRNPSGGISQRGFTAPFRQRGSWALSPFGYFATGQPDQYEVHLHIPGSGRRNDPGPPTWRTGDPVRKIRRRVPQVVVSEAERRDHRDDLEAQIESFGGRRSGSLPKIPTEKPAIRWVEFGEDGRLWVKVWMPSERYEPTSPETIPGQAAEPLPRWTEPTAFDVFEPNGRFLGRVVFPITEQPSVMRMRGDRIWCVVRNEDGVEVIKRYSITWP